MLCFFKVFTVTVPPEQKCNESCSVSMEEDREATDLLCKVLHSHKLHMTNGISISEANVM